MEVESLENCLTGMARHQAASEQRLVELAYASAPAIIAKTLRGRSDQAAEDRDDVLQQAVWNTITFARRFVVEHETELLSSDHAIVQRRVKHFLRVFYRAVRSTVIDNYRKRARRRKIGHIVGDVQTEESSRTRIMIEDAFNAEKRRLASAYSDSEDAVKQAIRSGLNASQRFEIRRFPAVRSLKLSKRQVEALIPSIRAKMEAELVIDSAERIFVYSWNNWAITDVELREKPGLKDLSERLFLLAKRRWREIVDRTTRG
jgi:hypothetical protein